VTNDQTAARFAGQPTNQTVDTRAETQRLMRADLAADNPAEFGAKNPDADGWFNYAVHAPHRPALQELEHAGPSRLAPVVAALRDKCNELTAENNRLHELRTADRERLAILERQMKNQASLIERQRRELSGAKEYGQWVERCERHQKEADRADEADAADDVATDHRGWKLISVTAPHATRIKATINGETMERPLVDMSGQGGHQPPMIGLWIIIMSCAALVVLMAIAAKGCTL
jgi:hypothetical protein